MAGPFFSVLLSNPNCSHVIIKAYEMFQGPGNFAQAYDAMEALCCAQFCDLFCSDRCGVQMKY